MKTIAEIMLGSIAVAVFIYTLLLATSLAPFY